MTINDNSPEPNDDTVPEESLGVPPSRSNNWKKVYAFLGLLGITGLILTILYAERPKKYEVMPKRRSPPVRSVYALVVSPLDSLSARATVDSVRAEVSGSDSSNINMIIGSTAIYKRFVSSAEFCRVLEEALRNARPVEVDKQAVLISQLSGILIKDTLRTKLMLFGQLASTDFEPIKKQMNTSSRIIVQRNKIFGPVEIVSYLRAPQSEAVERFLGYFKEQGISVTQKQINPSLLPGQF